jgi:hypothetical protein
MKIIMEAKIFWKLLSEFGEIGDKEYIEKIDYDEVAIEQIDTNWFEVLVFNGGCWDTIYTYPDGEPTSSDQWNDEEKRKFHVIREGLILPKTIVEQILKN